MTYLLRANAGVFTPLIRVCADVIGRPLPGDSDSSFGLYRGVVAVDNKIKTKNHRLEKAHVASRYSAYAALVEKY